MVFYHFCSYGILLLLNNDFNALLCNQWDIIYYDSYISHSSPVPTGLQLRDHFKTAGTPCHKWYRVSYFFTNNQYHANQSAETIAPKTPRFTNFRFITGDEKFPFLFCFWFVWHLFLGYHGYASSNFSNLKLQFHSMCKGKKEQH